MKVSIIIPVLDEADILGETLSAIVDQQAGDFEIIVVDGGSRDRTVEVASSYAQVIITESGRALQMNAGAAIAQGDVLLFLHADTVLPHDALSQVTHSISEAHRWGRFDVRLSGEGWMYRVIETMMNWRSCLTSIATGDQAIFVTKRLFEDIGGFTNIELMEDIELCKRLRVHDSVDCITAQVVTSSRRWQQHGIAKTVLLMWWLRLLYFLGVSPSRLATMYH